MQNDIGGFSEYEKRHGSPLLECLNAAEVFGGIMVSYDHVECTTSSVAALSLFSKLYPDYRADEIQAAPAQSRCLYQTCSKERRQLVWIVGNLLYLRSHVRT